MCGYICLDGVTCQHESIFREGLEHFQFFPEARTIKKYSGADFVIYTNSFLEDVFQTSDSFSIFTGYADTLSHSNPARREVARHFSQIENWQITDFNQFIDSRFSGVVIDRIKKNLRLCTDFFGKRKLFYKIIDNVCYFSNELKTLTPLPAINEQLDRQALRSYLSLGTSLGDRTLSTLIKSVPIQSYVTFDGNSAAVTSFKKIQEITKELLNADEVYEQFRKVLTFLTRDLNFNISDLTGGGDTRLTLAGLRKIGAQVRYTCESTGLDKNSADSNDFEVMSLLKEKYNLPVQFDFPDTRASRPFQKNSFEAHRHYEGDIYDRCLSGMFGGELFGGWAIDQFFSDDRMAQFRDLDKDVLADFPSHYFLDTISFEEELAEQAKSLAYSDPRTLLSISMLYSSPLYFREGEDAWLESYLLTSRKISAFLGDAVLRSLDVKNSSQQLQDYKFYLTLYKTCAPVMLETCFHSNFALLYPEAMTDIRALTVHEQFTAPATKDKTSLLQLKLIQLKNYLKDMKISAALEF